MLDVSLLFHEVEDPRRSNATRHDVQEMLLIALLSALSGGEEVAVDGKVLRCSFEDATERSPPHLVQAFAADGKLVLRQIEVDGRSHEIPALPKLLDVQDRMVTAHAMHTQRETSSAVLAKGGDDVLALKGHQRALREDVKQHLDDPPDDGAFFSHQEVDESHGRVEMRTASIIHDLGEALERHGWPGLAAVGRVVAECRPKDGKASVEPRYYITSAQLSAERFARAVRSHWTIENSLHWMLDVTMNEDGQRNRKDNGPSNLALLRRLDLNIARVQPGQDFIARQAQTRWLEHGLPPGHGSRCPAA